MLKIILMNMALPLVKKVLAGLGFAIFTFGSSQAILNYFISSLQDNLSATPTAVLQIVTLFGLPQAISIIMGGWSVALGLQSFKKLGLL